jgi:hypothetical protein
VLAKYLFTVLPKLAVKKRLTGGRRQRKKKATIVLQNGPRRFVMHTM